MVRRKLFFTRASRWFSFLLILAVFALMVSGCRSSGGGGIDNGENGNGGNGGGDKQAEFNVFKGVWKSVDVDPAVELMIDEPIEGTYETSELLGYQLESMLFTGKVSCSIFSEGHIDITNEDKNVIGDKYIWLTIAYKNNKIEGKSLNVQAQEKKDVGGDNVVTFSGTLTDNKTLKVDSMTITSGYNDLVDFSVEDIEEGLTFKKQ